MRDVVDSKNLRALADRLRAATEALTDPRDISIAQDYVRELEAIAAEQAADDTECESGPSQQSFRHGRLRASRKSGPSFLLRK